MANLIEDVLHHIFDYLAPLEWIQVSQVCKLWNTTVSKQWKTISEISHEYNDLEAKCIVIRNNKAQVISTKDAVKIAYRAAPFVKVLKASTKFYEKEKLILFGPFLYKIRNFEPDSIMKVLAQKATNITEIRFDFPPQKIEWKLIGTKNNGKIKLANFSTLIKNNFESKPTKVFFTYPEAIKFFQRPFPNLKKLSLRMDCELLTQMSSQILPYVSGLTSLKLSIVRVRCAYLIEHIRVSYTDFLDITKLSQLEELSLRFYETDVIFLDRFLNKLATRCPKLRKVKIVGKCLNDKELFTLLALPHLESLDVNTKSSFYSLINLPEMINLSRLHIVYNTDYLHIKSFGGVLKKMQKLTDLVAYSDNLKNPDTDKIVQLVREVNIVAKSQKKNLVVKPTYIMAYFKELRIGKNNAQSSVVSSPLNLTVRLRDETAFLQKMKEFLQNNLKVRLDEGTQCFLNF